MTQQEQAIQSTIWEYYKTHKRSELLWRGENISPYQVMVSEFMLQQTQVARVQTAYPRFLEQFPTLKTLASAPFEDVLRAWQGLGYNRRALNLHKTAQAIMAQHQGVIPPSMEELEQLPGIGQSTAGAICAFAFQQPVAFIETNIRRVFIHFFFPKTDNVKDSDILPYVEKMCDTNNPREWYYALMDYGVMLSSLNENPNRRSRHYHKQSQFEGSDRQVRSMVVKHLLKKPCQKSALVKELPVELERAERIIASLVQDQIIARKGTKLRIADIKT